MIKIGKKNHGRFSVAEGIARRITIGIPALIGQLILQDIFEGKK